MFSFLNTNTINIYYIFVPIIATHTQQMFRCMLLVRETRTCYTQFYVPLLAALLYYIWERL